MQAREYKPGNFHFAICGSGGTGKSSLLNSFRGMDEGDLGNASTGVTETTQSTTRYLPAKNSLLGNRGFWYDIPGSGSPDHPDKAYFNNHGLYIFDCLIILVGNRIRNSDFELMKNCNDWDIPFYLVRSKSDQDIKGEYDKLVCILKAENKKDSDDSDDEDEGLDKKTKVDKFKIRNGIELGPKSYSYVYE